MTIKTEVRQVFLFCNRCGARLEYFSMPMRLDLQNGQHIGCGHCGKGKIISADTGKSVYDCAIAQKNRHLCMHCDEPINWIEKIHHVDGRMHRECLVRSIAGSVTHQQRRCTCFGGGSGHDDPSLSVRENARAAFYYFQATQKKTGNSKQN